LMSENESIVLQVCFSRRVSCLSWLIRFFRSRKVVALARDLAHVARMGFGVILNGESLE
jgi:hypothetical protein